MQIDDYLAELADQGRALAAAADANGLDAAVPTCPGWQVRDLLAHTGAVHRWASANLSAGAPKQRSEFEAAPEHDLLEWYRDAHEGLLNTLATLPADWQCWTFFPADSPKLFWARRQAHETAIHRIDCEQAGGLAGAAASGQGSDLGTEFAADGIDELLSGFLAGRSGRVIADPARTLLVTPIDSAAWWCITAGPDGCHTRSGDSSHGTKAEDDDVDAVLRGTASQLYLWLWNRRPALAPELTGATFWDAFWAESVQVS